MKDFCILHSVQTGSGAHPASYRGLFPRGGGGGEADHFFPSSAEVNNGGAIPPISICLHGDVVN
jgi:hypothetical protein